MRRGHGVAGAERSDPPGHIVLERQNVLLHGGLGSVGVAPAQRRDDRTVLLEHFAMMGGILQ